MIGKLKVLTSLFMFAFSGLVLTGVAALAFLLTLPDVKQLERCFTTEMYSVYLCAGGENYVRLRDISPYVLHAVIVSEDGAFYSHEGFDWHEIQESLEQDLKTGQFRRGGSTLTQQLAKNAFLDKEKSLWRKVKEAYLAHAIEKHYKKDFILEKYLNVVEFGPDIYGVKPAAQHYFHKSPAQLNPLEAAYLAFLLPNPKQYSKNFASGTLTPFARKTVSVILKRMNAYGKLSDDGFRTAMNNMTNFPWHGMAAESFQAGSYSLDAPAVAPTIDTELPDEKILDEVVDEDRGAAPIPTARTSKKPAEEDSPHEPESNMGGADRPEEPSDN